MQKCKPKFTLPDYIYPPTWMVSAGVEEGTEMINTTVRPSRKSK